MTSWYEQCIHAFVRRDYPACSRLVLERWSSGVPVECGLWLLIAAQRLDHPSAATLRGQLLAQTRSSPHEHAFVLAACGELDAQEADIYRTDQRRACALDYYLGAGLLTKGDTESAHNLFSSAAAGGEDGQPERYLAVHELASPAPFGLNAVDNVRRLCASAMNLHNQGFYAQAVTTIDQAWSAAAGIKSLLGGDSLFSLLRIAAKCHSNNRDLPGARRACEEMLSRVADRRGEDAASAAIGLARLNFAAQDYHAAANEMANVLGWATLRDDRPAHEHEAQCLRMLTRPAGVSGTAEHATALAQLAEIYFSAGEMRLAERAMAFLRAQPLHGAATATELARRLSGIYTLGGWYHDAVEPTETLYSDHRRLLGDDHPFVDRIRENLIVLHATLANSHPLRRHITQALTVARATLADRYSSGGDFERRMHVAYTLGLLGLVVSVSTNRRLTYPELHADVALAVVERKGVTLEQTARARLASLPATSDQQQLRHRVRQHRTELLRLVVSTSHAEPQGPTADQQQLLDAAMHLDSAERSLTTTALTRTTEPVSLSDLTLTLAPGTCLIEFLVYRRFDVDRTQKVAAEGQDPASQQFFQESGFYTMVPSIDTDWFATHDDHAHPEDRYAAVVLTSHHAPAVIDIADAATVGDLVDDTIRDITHPLRRLEDSDVVTSADRLSRVLLDPLWELIRGYDHLVISPDASLCRVPFDILRDPDGKLLLEDHLVTYTASARAVRQWGQAPAASGPPVVFGDPDFGTPLTGRPQAVRFRPLPATRTEAEAVAHALGVTAVLGQKATPERLVECRSPRVLHLATHAFSVPDIHRLLGTLPGTLPKIVADDPLLLSGIALAGANTTLAGLSGPNGVLFAHEVQDLDLTGTELVVLSACDSGVGRLSAGHGVYGLRRALSIAGAHSQLMSLWQVPSAQSAQLMAAFYQFLGDGADRGTALARAKAAVRTVKRHPYYWAGFVLEGDPGPLV
jgi:CHAT domain-containing protein